FNAGNARAAGSADAHARMFRPLNARLRPERQRENFTRRNVPGVIGLGKLRHCESFIGQAHRRLWTRTAKRRTSAKEKPQVLGGLSLAMNGVRCAKQCAEANQRRQFAGSRGEKRTFGVDPES